MGAYEDAGQDARIRRERHEAITVAKRTIADLNPRYVVLALRDLLLARVAPSDCRREQITRLEDLADLLKDS